MRPVFSFRSGQTPLLISVPHAGTLLPPALGQRLTQAARRLPDTDWYVDRLYRRFAERGPAMLVASYSRYVVDLNRPPDDVALYEGSPPGLVPDRCFDGSAIYLPGRQPAAAEKDQRVEQFWRPYHQKLALELGRIRQRHGYAVLLDAHSVRSEVPALFSGRLPDLNLGSYKGASADRSLIDTGLASLAQQAGYSLVLDGRFQGGYITRHYGKPAENVHALQLEIAQSTYLCEQAPRYDERMADKFAPVLTAFVCALLAWSPP